MGKGGNASGEILTVDTINKKNDLKNDDGSPKSVLNDSLFNVKTTNNTASTLSSNRPWYIRGGFHVNQIGMGFNVVVPPAILLLYSKSDTETSVMNCTPQQLFLVALFVQIVFAVMERMKTVYCIAAVPIYLASLIAVPFTLSSSIVPIVLAVVFAIWRGGICMSVCLHRYAAHGAFKCGSGMRLILHVLGSAGMCMYIFLRYICFMMI